MGRAGPPRLQDSSAKRSTLVQTRPAFLPLLKRVKAATNTLLGWARPNLSRQGAVRGSTPSGLGMRESSAYDMATSSVFQSPWCMICQMGTPRMNAILT
jgi:hypothetical protein